MENIRNYIKQIESYTICLYGEFCGTCKPFGSGILIHKEDKFYIISAYHVFDREEETIRVENDPGEYGIDHDDTDSVFVRVKTGDNVEFYRINDFMKDVVFTAHPDKDGQAIINEDTEYTVCHLTDGMVMCLREAGKKFYDIRDENVGNKRFSDTIVLSGYPQYAQKNDTGIYRSFHCEMNKSNPSSEECLIRVMFDNQKAYNHEQLKTVQIPGIAGMSGGGIWEYANNEIIPIGIILKQDPGECYVEGYRFDKIINDLERKINK